MYYQIGSSASDTELEVEITDLTADVDLYVLEGAEPTLESFDCRPYTGDTNSELCILPNSEPVTWFIGVNGYNAGDFTITATLFAD